MISAGLLEMLAGLAEKNLAACPNCQSEHFDLSHMEFDILLIMAMESEEEVRTKMSDAGVKNRGGHISCSGFWHLCCSSIIS